MLYGRKKELGLLEDRYARKGCQLVSLYGKRRTGKTKLLQSFCQDKDHCFYVCRETTDQKQLQLFSKRLLEDSPLKDYIDSFPDWESLFNFLFSQDNPDPVTIIDEFPYMVQNNPEIPSILQKVLDQEHEGDRLLVVTGSAMTYMEKEILGGKKALFGRSDQIIELKELSPLESLDLLGERSVQAIRTVCLLGGVPRYLLDFDPKASLEDNIKERLLSKGAPLYQEVDYIMRQDLREPSTYYTILEAMAGGAQTISAISKATGLDRTKINVYLHNLIQQRVVVRKSPLQVWDKKGPKASRYHMANGFFAFYFRFIYPHISLLETQAIDRVYADYIKDQLDDFLRPGLVGLATGQLARDLEEGRIPFEAQALGSYWDKEVQIDLLATGPDQSLLAGQVVIDESGASLADYQKLRERLALARLKGKKRGFVIYGLYGHQDALKEMAKLDEDLFLVSLKED